MKTIYSDKLFLALLFNALEDISKEKINSIEKLGKTKRKAFKKIDKAVQGYIQAVQAFTDDFYNLLEAESAETKGSVSLASAIFNDRLNDYLGVCMCLKVDISLNDSGFDVTTLKAMAKRYLEAEEWPDGFHRKTYQVESYSYITGDPFGFGGLYGAKQ